MNRENDLISVEVSLPAWSESEKSYYLLTKRGGAPGSWSCGSWYPKKVTQLLKTIDPGTGILVLPAWLYNKKVYEKIEFTRARVYSDKELNERIHEVKIEINPFD